jgi:NagD protein
MPDVGSFIELIRAAVGRVPDIVCGKPFKPVADGIMLKYKTESRKTAMVGDRLYTDIRFGNNFGFCSVLVLTGDAAENPYKYSSDRPDLTLNSVADMLELL